MRHLFLLFFLLYYTTAAHAQRLTGLVRDKESRTPLPGALIFIDTAGSASAITDTNGAFVVEDLPTGKYSVTAAMAGYQHQKATGVLLTAGRDAYLEFFLEEKATALTEVSVSAKRGVRNEMALISARPFDVQETERYAGSRSDPARMASNFAGVQGADDSRNDIIVRGNSPMGVLWRMEDLDMPNPNHFAIPGSSGGPVSMLNNKTLANSDFFTGAFPAEYGNSTAGVFDLKLRRGNQRRYEATAQLGFLGTELAAEGPLSRKENGASFLVTYRYSTLKLFEGLNIKIGTNSVPNYQDAAFNLFFPMGRKSSLMLFGIGGLSKIDLIVSKLTEPSEELYGESDRDQYFKSNTGMVGAAFQSTLSDRTFAKVAVGFSASQIGGMHDKVFRDADFQVDSLKPILDYENLTNAVVAHAYVNHKINRQQTFTVGLINNLYLLNYRDSSRQYPPTLQEWQQRENFIGNTDLAQAYAQYKYRPNDRLSLTGGLHTQFLTHNKSFAIEPRAALRYLLSKGAISLGYGLHSQLQPLYQYFAHLPQKDASQMHNYEVGFTRAHHFVAGYEWPLGNAIRLRTEAYYQYLFDVPIETRAGSSFSGLNQGADFSRLFPDTLVNKGTGYNYGLELTLEKAFSKGYYFLFTGSLFDSKAKGNDGMWRNTDFNGRFAVNALGGYEPKLSDKTTLLTGIKITWAGGRLYSPPDTAASNALGDFVAIDAERNTLSFPNYFRVDARLGVRISGKKLTHELAVDLVNVAGIKNVLSLIYSPDLAAQGKDPFIRQYQLGFLPLFYYRVDFGW